MRAQPWLIATALMLISGCGSSTPSDRVTAVKDERCTCAGTILERELATKDLFCLRGYLPAGDPKRIPCISDWTKVLTVEAPSGETREATVPGWADIAVGDAYSPTRTYPATPDPATIRSRYQGWLITKATVASEP